MSGLFQKSIQPLKLHGNFVVVCLCAFVAGTKVCGVHQILKGVTDSRKARNRCFTGHLWLLHPLPPSTVAVGCSVQGLGMDLGASGRLRESVEV